MQANAPTITLPRAAVALERPAAALRRFLVRNPGFCLVRAPALQPRFSFIDLVRLGFVTLLTESGFPEPDALRVVDGTLDRRLYGLALCSVPVPVSMLQSRLWNAAWHICPGTPPLVSHVEDGPPLAAVCLTINLEALTADLAERLNATANTKEAA